MFHRGRQWWTLGAMCVALSMIMLDSTAVNVALPRMQRDLRADTALAEWVISGYMVPFAVLQVPLGRLADVLGRRRIFLAGCVVFTVASAGVALAGTGEFLVAARVFQGIGAAALMPATLALIASNFPESERGRAIGIWTGVSSASLAVGPTVGGVLVEYGDWRDVFLLNLPLGLVVVVLTLGACRESPKGTAREFDVLGSLALCGTLAAIVVAITEGNHWGWASPAVLGLAAGALLALLGFVVVEHRARVRLIDLRALRSRLFAGAGVAGGVVYFSAIGALPYIGLQLQNVLRLRPIVAGLWLLPSTLAIMVMGPVSSRLTARFGFRTVISAGLGTVAVASASLSIAARHPASWLVIGALALLGIGMGAAMAPVSIAAVAAVPPEQTGMASGTIATIRMFGSALGVAVLGAIVSVAGRSYLNARLPASDAGLASELGASLVAGRSGVAGRGAYAELVGGAYVHGLSMALAIGAGVALLSALTVFTLLPAPGARSSDLAPARMADRSASEGS